MIVFESDPTALHFNTSSGLDPVPCSTLIVHCGQQCLPSTDCHTAFYYSVSIGCDSTEYSTVVRAVLRLCSYSNLRMIDSAMQMIHQKMIDFEDFTIQSIVPVISSPSGPVTTEPTRTGASV